MKDKPIPNPSPELIAQCDAENQFSNFERVFRKVMSVPKAEVLKRERKRKAPQRTETGETEEKPMNWYRVALGFAVSIAGGEIVIYPIMEWYLWPRLRKQHEESKPKGGTFTRQLGWLERALYTGALLVGAWQWIGIWLAIKVASRWRSTSGDSDAPVDNVWLIGTGLSVLFGFVGAWIALSHLPTFGKP